MTRVVLLAMLALTGCAENQLRVATAIDVALISCDVGQTYYASDGGRWDRPGERPNTVQVEFNPVLGATPSPDVLLAGLAVTTIGTTIIGTSPLPSWVRAAFLIAVGATEGYLVAEHMGTAGACGIR